ncbi:aminoglycoside phosphotransferase [Paenibacillus albiflavus]|uniref:Aminoglycoside phosphotransferase n=1 Tax=Paenibacillus albiflavus TaxID=2545760 RepID=A0A4R4E9V0_9BACL|nr:phosphotransferase [Paenibacillus albiflavus]TCZ75793.1 aminoglycoside phosphotransferase [Paenibacillus albiflavus]
MIPFFQFDTNEQRNALLARGRKVALSALQQFNIEWVRITFIQLSDTITYQIETTTSQSYLLRIHSDRLNKQELQSELALLQSMNESADLVLPKGLPNSHGSYVLEIETDEGYRRPYVTIMHWVEGELVNGKITEEQAYSMGVMAARLHQATASFIPPSDFTRPVWGADHFRREFDRLRKYYSCFLSEQAWTQYVAASEKIVSELANIQPTKLNFGIVHGDLHTGNIVVDQDDPRPIDFGRCGHGYYLYDLAHTILSIHPPIRSKLIQGYESIRKLETDYVRLLETFFIMSMIETYCHHASNPSETANLIAEQPYAQALIRDYLQGAPFLFNPIKPMEIKELS